MAEPIKKLKCLNCEAYSSDTDHRDVADCMRDLMRYLGPMPRNDPKIKAVIEAGYQAMKRELDLQRIGEESTFDGV